MHLVSPCSDHPPLLIHLDKERHQPDKRRCKQYEVFWERAGELPEIVENIWAELDVHDSLGNILLPT